MHIVVAVTAMIETEHHPFKPGIMQPHPWTTQHAFGYPPPTDEVTATEFANELIDAAVDGRLNDGIAEVLKHIKDEVVWTNALSQTQGGQELERAIQAWVMGPKRWDDNDLQGLVTAVGYAKYLQVRDDDDVRQVEARWWGTVPLPRDAERITLSFRDVSGLPSTSTPSSGLNEPHSLHCARVLSQTSCATSPNNASYIRNDEDNQLEYQRSPARYCSLWDLTLPPWCVTPDHWVEPVPPPRFLERQDPPPAPKVPYYKKIPTLHFTGNGRHIVPSAKKPELIARSLFFPVQDGSE
ncbi:hypothetical protein LXA43DRAFT_1095953 [Ganoderma leucocontextum]|nr:hypothetical protein LXA43DRAFT_1095953 [Ganoderma leucocontextum]